MVNVLSADGSRGMRRGVELLVGYDGGGTPALRGDVYGCSSSDQPRCDDFDWRTDVGGRDGGDEFSEVHHGERWRDCYEFWCWGQGGSIDSAWTITM